MQKTTFLSLDGKRLIRFIGEDTEYNVPSSVTSIGYEAFVELRFYKA